MTIIKIIFLYWAQFTTQKFVPEKYWAQFTTQKFIPEKYREQFTVVSLRPAQFCVRVNQQNSFPNQLGVCIFLIGILSQTKR